MARKVLISFLGTGSFASKETRTYRTANYHLGEKNLGSYPFISAALRKHYDIDCILLVGTVHSMWEEVYRWFCEDNKQAIDEDAYISIADACEKSNYLSDLAIPYQDLIEQTMGGGSKVVLIKYGLNEEEIRTNTDIILGLQQYLQNNDELIVDVTHAFRSLPLFMMNLLIYLKNVSQKKISITHIHYGMLDISKELGYAPIIDLKSMMDVNDWITGAYSFSEFGNAYKISKLIKDEDGNVSTLLEEFSNLMNLNHLHAIQKIAQRLASIKNKNYKTLIPELTITPIVQSFISQFGANNTHSLFQLKVARWQLDHRKYAQAFLTVQESIITYVCEQNHLQWDNKDNREGIKDLLLYKTFPEARCDNKLRKLFKDLIPLRNCVAHSLETDKNVVGMVRILTDTISTLETIILSMPGNLPKPNKEKRQRLFINFSNHPFQDWGQSQQEAAKKYGTIVDIPFPDVSPTNIKKDLSSLVNQYVQKITSISKDKEACVHIMGEMTFTFMVVTRLKEMGIKCVASTTERKTTYNDDGTKQSEFSFVRFREY